MTKAMASMVMMMGLATGSAMAQDIVYAGKKPYWWDLPMKCNTYEDGAVVCGAGAWSIPALADRSGMDGQIAAGGSVIRYENGDESVLIDAGFKPKRDCFQGTETRR